jgi:hypothetical protein
MARFYANENFPFPAVLALRRLGHDVTTTAESGRSGQRIPDEEVLQFASSQGFAVLTMNRRHFVRLHQMVGDHAGIVVCSSDADFEKLAQRIHEAILPHPSLRRLLLRVNRPAE